MRYSLFLQAALSPEPVRRTRKKASERRAIILPWPAHGEVTSREAVVLEVEAVVEGKEI